MDWMYKRREGARISDKLSWYGRPIVLMENDYLRLVILPSRGADIVSLYNKSAACECLIRPIVDISDFSDRNPIKPKVLSAGVCSWPFMFPVASHWGDYFGQEQPFHGEAHLLPWEYRIIKDLPELVEVELFCFMQLTPFYVRRIVSLPADEPRVILREEVRNLSNQTLPIMWGHHPTFGEPFLSSACRIYLPAGRFYKGDESMLDIRSKDAGLENMFYLLDFKEGWYGIYNRERGFGVGMSWDNDLFKVVWIWQEYGSNRSAPYFGRRYAVAIEPVSSLPQIDEIDIDMRRRYGPVHIGANSTMSAELSVFFFEEPDQIKDRAKWVL